MKLQGFVECSPPTWEDDLLLASVQVGWNEQLKNHQVIVAFVALTILTPPTETLDPPNDTRGASKQVVLTTHDIWRIPRVENHHQVLQSDLLIP